MAIKEHMEELDPAFEQRGLPGNRDAVLPKGSRFHASELPESVLMALKPHHSDWRKLDVNQARNQGNNANFLYFSFSHGHWSQVRDAATARRGDKWLAFVRATPRKPNAGGGGPAATAALSKSDIDALQHYVQAAAAEEKVPIPVKMPEYRKLTIIVLPGNPDAPKPVRFSIDGAQGAKQVWGSDGTQKTSYTFERIPANGKITLTASADGQTQDLIHASHHGDVMDFNRYRFPNDGNGPLVYVLNHELHGATPVITVATEPPQLGIFFDGTGNNMYNDMADTLDGKAPTNIAKLYELYNASENGVIRAEYLSGIGTEIDSTENDIDEGIAYTFGNRITDAIKYANNYFRKYKKAQFALIDVFGFSRGAAQARAFVNEVLRLSVRDPGHWGGPQIQFRFLGLFDTVGSVGIAGDDDNSNWYVSSGLSGPISLAVHPSAVQHAVHLTAYDEKRKYFPLSSLQTAKSQLPGNFIEEVWPGAHSDIGGGYAYGEDKVYFPFEEKIILGPISQEEKKEIETRLKHKYESENPGIHIDVEMYSTRSPNQIEPLVKYVFFPVWKRDIQSQLANVTLQRMYELAIKHEVPMASLSKLSQKGLDYHIPDDLKAWEEQVKREGFGGNAHFYIEQFYIHHSDQYGNKPDSHIYLTNPNQRENKPEVTAPNGIRKMFYNNLEKAVSPRSDGPAYQIKPEVKVKQTSVTKGRY